MCVWCTIIVNRRIGFEINWSPIMWHVTWIHFGHFYNANDPSLSAVCVCGWFSHDNSHYVFFFVLFFHLKTSIDNRGDTVIYQVKREKKWYKITISWSYRVSIDTPKLIRWNRFIKKKKPKTKNKKCMRYLFSY